MHADPNRRELTPEAAKVLQFCVNTSDEPPADKSLQVLAGVFNDSYKQHKDAEKLGIRSRPAAVLETAQGSFASKLAGIPELATMPDVFILGLDEEKLMDLLATTTDPGVCAKANAALSAKLFPVRTMLCWDAVLERTA
jgi:hypothetical protein